LSQLITLFVGLFVGAVVTYYAQRRLWLRDARLHSYASFAQAIVNAARTHEEFLDTATRSDRLDEDEEELSPEEVERHRPACREAWNDLSLAQSELAIIGSPPVEVEATGIVQSAYAVSDVFVWDIAPKRSHAYEEVMKHGLSGADVARFVDAAKKDLGRAGTRVGRWLKRRYWIWRFRRQA
jgi:hypothetical protein